MTGVLIAFQNYSIRRGVLGSDWVGLYHFIDFMTSPLFPELLRNTALLSLYSLVLGFPVPIIFALFLNETGNKYFKKTVQMVTYAPHFISTVVVVGIIMQFLHLRNGFINNFITLLGGKPINFFGVASLFRPIYVLSGIWQNIGYSSIVYIAALSSIDQSMTEAAHIDGVSRLQRVLFIDLPSIMPTIITLLILQLGNVLSVGFEKAFLLQNPLNLAYSEIISTFVYKRGLQNVQYSFATAVGLFNSVINLIFIAGANALARRFSDTSLW
ncbi:MAG: ABC transporter permease subunit [Treponema sp.]|nr:ABC transporter permease subunit [Treponema sp.]